MSSQTLRPIALTDFARHEMLQVVASVQASAKPTVRQAAIEGLCKLHGINLTTTKSLRYDASFLKHDGINSMGRIRIGPSAFKQGREWLANVLFHEVIHSDQFHFYAKQGVQFGSHQVKSEPERLLIALDEFEAFYLSLKNARTLGLSPRHTSELVREVRLHGVDLDDPQTKALVGKRKFRAARLELIERLKKRP